MPSRRWIVLLLAFGMAGCLAVAHLLAPAQSTTLPTPIAQTTTGVMIQRGDGREIDGVAALGVPHVRMAYYPAFDAAFSTGPQVIPDYRTLFRARLDYLDTKGIDTLIVVPDFTDQDEAVTVMAALTTDYRARTWQVGNEYDAKAWITWCHTGSQYAALMQRVVAVCPLSTSFVSMGLATADWHAAPIQPDKERRQAFYTAYQQAGGPTLAAWCLHGYGLPATHVLTQQVTDFQQVLKGSAPLWLTEVGTSRMDIEHATGPQSLATIDAMQAQYASEVLAVAPTLGLARVYWYAFWDDTDDQFGLTRIDDTPRPAWDILHSTRGS